MSKVWFPQCLWCRHFHSETTLQLIKTCDAFPDEIPEDIFQGYFEHNRPYAGDQGILFEEQADETLLPEIIRDMPQETREFTRKLMYDVMLKQIASGKKKNDL